MKHTFAIYEGKIHYGNLIATFQTQKEALDGATIFIHNNPHKTVLIEKISRGPILQIQQETKTVITQLDGGF